MGYLADQNNEIIVDAILTKYGREKLASGQQLGIIKFALSDDEIDYSLYNTNHPMGSDYFDIAIRKLPVLEPVPNSTTQFRYILYSSQDQITFGSILSFSAPGEFVTGLGSTALGKTYNITPSLTPTPTNSSLVWYSAKLGTAASSYITLTGNVTNTPQDLAKILATPPVGPNKQTADSIVCYGQSFNVKVNALPSARTKYLITLNASDASVSPVTVLVTLDAATIIGGDDTNFRL